MFSKSSMKFAFQPKTLFILKVLRNSLTLLLKDEFYDTFLSENWNCQIRRKKFLDHWYL